MSLWVAIGLVGGLSYVFRLVPFLLADRVTLTPRVEDALRHASIGAMCALLVGTAHAAHQVYGHSLALALALAVAGLLAWANRSMLVIVVAGSLVYAGLAGLIGV